MIASHDIPPHHSTDQFGDLGMTGALCNHRSPHKALDLSREIRVHARHVYFCDVGHDHIVVKEG